MQSCEKTSFIPVQPAQVFGPLNKGQEAQEIEKNEVSSIEDLSFSVLTLNAKNIFEEQAEAFKNKAASSLISLKGQVSEKNNEITALKQEKALMDKVIEQNKKEIKALKRRLDLQQLSPKTVDQFQKSVDHVAANFKVLEAQIEEQKIAFDKTSPQENILKAKAFNQAWSSENKDLKALAKQVEDLFKPCMLDSKAHDSEALKSLNQSWSAVKTSDYKLEKSKQHLALKDQLRSFMMQLEDSHKALAAEVKDLSDNLHLTPGVEYSYIHGYKIIPEQKAEFEVHLNKKLEKFNELQGKVVEHNKKFDALAPKFNLLKDQSHYARRLAAGDEQLSAANVQTFNKITKEINNEKIALYSLLVGGWNKFNSLHVDLCTKIAVLQNAFASEKLIFPKESYATFDKEKLLLPVKKTSLL